MSAHHVVVSLMTYNRLMYELRVVQAHGQWWCNSLERQLGAMVGTYAPITTAEARSTARRLRRIADEWQQVPGNTAQVKSCRCCAGNQTQLRS